VSRNKIKKIISTLALALLLMVQVAPVWAISPSTPPPPPEAPSAPSAPDAPQPPSAPDAPSAPGDPGPSSDPQTPPSGDSSSPTETVDTVQEQTPQEDSNWDGRRDRHNRDNNDEEGGNTSSPESNVEPATSEPQPANQQGEQTGDQNNGGNVGDTSITSGDANTSASIVTSANDNLSAQADCTTGCEPGGITVKNSGNGDNSTNDGSVSVSNDETTVQDNSANVDNSMNLQSDSGHNDASRNVGNSSIDTGDANTTGTLITAVNTNVDGVAVAEFNIADDHVGDIVLDFPAGCISGCAGSGSALSVVNDGNGADSQNTGSIEETNNDTTFQTNEATVENEMILNADTGNNTANRNTGGDSTITTGDANTSANALTFANNNLAGGVYYTVVNIFGDLIGDIIFPEEMLAYAASVSAANTGNGDGSVNTSDLTLNSNDETYQFNVANIENNLILGATTGDNDTSRNTNGTSSVTTGDANVDAQVLNIANSNISGGIWWLVIVNEAGNWIGKLFGAADGANFAGSAGTEFTINDAGEITAVNSGNGAGSTNTSDVTVNNNTTTVQSNTANITNNLDLSANTGGNSASRNTGGDSSITTGDANVIANLVNFVNNNISGGGKLFVNVVNVFGSWVGDFLPPGFSKPKSEAQDVADAGVGGPENGGNQSNSADSGSSSAGGSGNSQNSSSATTQPTGTLLAQAASTGFGGSFQTMIAGAVSYGGETSQDNNSQEAVKRVVNINLAWFLALLPILLISGIIRRRVRISFSRKHLP